MQVHNYRNQKTAEAVAAYWGKSLKDKNWYAMEQDGDNAEIRIYDVIGWPWIDADSFINELNRISASTITVAINSPGGDVFDGTAIYNALKNHSAHIITRIDGIAASMASVIHQAGDERQVMNNVYGMIHNAWGISIGDYREMLKTGEFLDKVSGTLALSYAERSGKSIDDMRAIMDEETWLIGQELVDDGFADVVIGEESQNAEARFNLDMYNNAPEQVNAHGTGSMKNKRQPPSSIREIESGLRAMGYSRSVATNLAGVINSAQRDSVADDQSDSVIDDDCIKAGRNLLAIAQRMSQRAI